MIVTKTAHSTSKRKQRTIAKPIQFSGLGVHTGKEVTMRFCPAAEDTGIIFKRTDLPGMPEIPAHIRNVRDTTRSTTIGHEKALIHTVEHVLAALHALEVDNLLIEVSNLEPPIGDGSSATFVAMLEEATIQEQPKEKAIAKISRPLYWSDGDIHLVALPSDSYKISYTLSYSDPNILRSQFHSLVVNGQSFKSELAPCRTFSRYEEVAMLMDKGLIKGGSLDNAVIIKGEAVFSKGGLHFPNEMVRHKILDLIGDLSLVGFPFHAHIISIRSGHASNFQLAKVIHQHITEEH
jgi:UDP-3-O-[3-hydroxymyristoyl] N-acetylglucosamine deacetylase